MIETIDDNSFERGLLLALDLARRAGALTLRYHRSSSLAVDRKAFDEPVTEADRASQALILDGLRAASPDYGILAEEQEDIRSWASHRLAWVVDPIDGTKDFVRGEDGYSVMIGLLRDFRPVVGVVHQPVTGLTFAARHGAPAFMLRGASGERLPLRTTGTADPARLRLVTSRSHRAPEIDRVKSELAIEDELNVGSVGLKISLLARGLRDLYVNPVGHCKLWDTCAPEVVLHQAGGRMTDRYGRPIAYSPEEVQVSHGIVATNGACHDEVIRRLGPVFGPPPSR